MNTVLFAGAGFSAPFGQPTMNQFMSYALDKIEADDKRFLLELVLDARRANSMLESSPTNLEDLLSFAVMGDRLELFGSEKKERAPKLRQILRDIYSLVPPSELDGFWSKYDVLTTFLGVSQSREFEGLSIITTNYDLNVECALLRAGARAVLPFDYAQHSRGENLYVVPKAGEKPGHFVPLFKLHGSVNLFEKEGDTVEAVGSVVSTQGGTNLPYACVNNFKFEGTPLIIPPTFLKPDISGVMLDIWKGAASALNSAQVIIFVGYSFPMSDIEMRYFFARSLTDNAQLRRILVVDVNANQIVDRLKREGSGFGSHFKSFLEPIEIDWTKRYNVLT
jgi:hypothetical protein